MGLLEAIMTYFNQVGAPVVYSVPNISCFGLEGPGADGLEQGEGFIIGCYMGKCSLLDAEYCYAIYSICFSTSFVDLPYDFVYGEINHHLTSTHWVISFI